MTPEEFSILLNKWRTGQVTPDEARSFVALANTGRYDELIQEAMEIDLDIERFKIGATKEGKTRHWQFIQDQMNDIPSARIVHRVHFLRTAWFRVAVAILIISGVGAYLWNNNAKPKVETVTIKPVPEKNDIMPGSDKAILTLSDGRKITLNATGGETITDGELQIRNLKNGLIYGSSNVAAYNTMSTPKGGQYKLTLADGTKVWLNAASSITYPTSFTGNTREVSITGEAYLEVKQDKQKPFIVTTKDQKIEVLGTEFNVNTYEDEKPKISLINGAIKINNKVLKPGQALLDGNIHSTNIDQDIAWKNGAFNFENTNLSSALKQLSRWYDVEIVFENNIPGKMIAGEMGRDLSLMQVLRILKRMGINTRLEKRNLIILSN